MLTSTMLSTTPTELKTILHSKRANLYYLEHCRVLVNGGRVEYVTERGKRNLYWNIPIANTTSLILGTGTSLTQAAMRELSKAGVLVGFCGGGGTPLYAGTETVWLLPQSEYRPVEYVQAWTRLWFDEDLRLRAAKQLQAARLACLERSWNAARFPGLGPWVPEPGTFRTVLATASEESLEAKDGTSLLLAEARLSKQLYKHAANVTRYGEFTRTAHEASIDIANQLLDHGNYLAYGLGATAAWVLGIPHAFALLHGKTRRGGLVFDFADLIKDAYILPLAFVAAMKGWSDEAFREQCISTLTQEEALDFIIDTAKDISTMEFAP